MSNQKNKTVPAGLLFSVAGARGIVGKGIDEDVVRNLVTAFSAILKPGPIVIGRDTRPSGHSLMQAAIDAVLSSGRECISLGIAATPTVEIMVGKLGAAGGIIVSASHNPKEWNALKFLDERGIFINKSLSDELYRLLVSGVPRGSHARAPGKARVHKKASEEHVDAILSLGLVDPNSIAKRSFKVVLDCINGAGSVIAPMLLEKLGVEVIKIDCKTDGDFHRNPEPRPENLHAIAEEVKRQNADIGFALDPDADRLALADPIRGALSEEYTLGIAVDYVLSKKQGPVVVNLSTSSLIDVIAGRYGSGVIRTPIGEAHVVSAMVEKKAIIGGEGNGGVILPDLHRGRDGLAGMALILQHLADKECRLSDLIDSYPPFFIVKDKSPLEGDFPVDEISDIILKEKPINMDKRDGVKAVFQEGWYHLRVSNTEGVVRIIAEASDEAQALELARRARDNLKASLRKN